MCLPKRSGLSVAILLALASAAFAQVTAEQQSAIRSNCRSDFMSKCSGVSPGGKDALACLQKNVEALAPGCKTAVSATLPKPAAAAPVAAAPPPAAAKVEPPPAPATTAEPKPPAQPRPVTAAKPVAPKLDRAAPPKPVATPSRAASAPPKPAAPPPQTASAPPAPPPPAATPPKPATPVDAAVMLRACKIDLVRHCAGAPAGDGRKLACLNEHQGSLTVRCRTALRVTAPIR